SSSLFILWRSRANCSSVAATSGPLVQASVLEPGALLCISVWLRHSFPGLLAPMPTQPRLFLQACRPGRIFLEEPQVPDETVSPLQADCRGDSMRGPGYSEFVSYLDARDPRSSLPFAERGRAGTRPNSIYLVVHRAQQGLRRSEPKPRLRRFVVS